MDSDYMQTLFKKLDRNFSRLSNYHLHRIPPGLLASADKMHMDFYSCTVNFGMSFEVFISRDLADLLPKGRIDDTNNEVCVAVRSGITLGRYS
jgi:hypothetical protein